MWCCTNCVACIPDTRNNERHAGNADLCRRNENNVDEQLSKTVEELHQNYAGAQIISHSLIGDVSDEVSTWAKENNPDLIVIGTHQALV
jgi:nucleotide-binding universal stress UspA family protein